MSHTLPPATNRVPLHLQRLMDRDGFTRRLQGREDLVATVTGILFRHNPVGLSSTDAQEYRAEAETIVALLDHEATLPQTHETVHGEFVNWFDAEMAGGRENYTRAATEIWHAIKRHAVEQHSGPAALRGVIPEQSATSDEPALPEQIA